MEQVRNADCVIFAVAHRPFRELTPAQIDAMFAPDGPKVLIDIRNQFDTAALEALGIHCWSL